MNYLVEMAILKLLMVGLGLDMYGGKRVDLEEDGKVADPESQ